MFCSPHCSRLSPTLNSIVTPNSVSTIVFNVVDNYEQCVQHFSTLLHRRLIIFSCVANQSLQNLKSSTVEEIFIIQRKYCISEKLHMKANIVRGIQRQQVALANLKFVFMLLLPMTKTYYAFCTRSISVSCWPCFESQQIRHTIKLIKHSLCF